MLRDGGEAEWSRVRDPENLAWTWEGTGGRGQPLRFLPRDFTLKSITAATSATLFFCVATKIVILPLQPVTEFATTLKYHSFDANLGEKTADFSDH
jgi:hypothetical protein